MPKVRTPCLQHAGRLMDPDACLREIIDAAIARRRDDLVSEAHKLSRWLMQGGPAPVDPRLPVTAAIRSGDWSALTCYPSHLPHRHVGLVDGLSMESQPHEHHSSSTSPVTVTQDDCHMHPIGDLRWILAGQAVGVHPRPESDGSEGDFTRLSIPGNECCHCGTRMTQSLVCPGCGHCDPLTKRPNSGEDADAAE